MSLETGPPEEGGKGNFNPRKYFGITFEMALIIGLFVYGGIQWDAYYGREPGLITALCSVAGVFVALYNLYRRI